MDELVERLDVLIGLFRLANSDQLERAAAAVRSDKVADAILESCSEWANVGDIKSTVARALSTSEKTVQRRIAELTDARLIKADGAGPSRRVKSSGLI